MKIYNSYLRDYCEWNFLNSTTKKIEIFLSRLIQKFYYVITSLICFEYFFLSIWNSYLRDYCEFGFLNSTFCVELQFLRRLRFFMRYFNFFFFNSHFFRKKKIYKINMKTVFCHSKGFFSSIRSFTFLSLKYFFVIGAL